METKKYNPSKLGKELLGKAISITPKASQNILQSAIPLIYSAFSADIGLDVSHQDICDMAPGRHAIKNLVAEQASLSYLRVIEILKKNPHIYLLADKANSDKKGAQSATLPKIMAFTNKETYTIQEFILDCDASGEDSTEVAKAIISSLNRLQEIDSTLSFIVMGQCTDSGGGGTLFALERAFRKLNLPGMHVYYLVGSCSLHNLQTALRNAIQQVFGEGGKDEKGEHKMNAMQLMHGMYNIQNYLTSDVLKTLWQEACTALGVLKSHKLLLAPVLTRWWSVGVCAEMLDVDWEIMKYVNNALVNLPNKEISDALRKIVCGNKNLLGKNEIRSDIKIIVEVHRNFMTPHFEFLQRGDPVTGNVAGYQARLLLTHYFLMCEDLTSCTSGKWKEKEGWKNIVHYNLNNLDCESQQVQDKKCAHTFNIMLASIHKHFDPWANRHLPLSLFSEQPISQAVASFLLNAPPNPVMYESKIHGRNIDVRMFHLFLRKRCTTISNILNTEEVTKHHQEIQLMQQGFDLWNGLPPPILQEYRDHYRLHYGSFPTASQNAERGVKLANHCTLQKRGERQRSLYATAGSEAVKKSNILARELYKPTNWRKSALKEGEIIRTKMKSIALISDTVRNHNEDQFDNNKKMNAKRVLTSETSSYKKQRKDNFLVAFRAHQNVPRPTPHRNETREGVTRTSLLLDRKDFGKMRVAAH